MEIIYSDHALKRIRQRGITELEVEYVLQYPIYVKKSFEDRIEAAGMIQNRAIKVVYFKTERYLKIITII